MAAPGVRADLMMFRKAYIRSFLADIVRGKGESKRIQEFLGVQIVSAKKRLRKRIPSKQRKQNLDQRDRRNPTWKVFASLDDQSRTRAQHEEKLKHLERNKISWELWKSKEPLSEEPPDPDGVAALLNVLASQNPAIPQVIHTTTNISTRRASGSGRKGFSRIHRNTL